MQERVILQYKMPDLYFLPLLKHFYHSVPYNGQAIYLHLIVVKRQNCQSWMHELYSDLNPHIAWFFWSVKVSQTALILLK